MKPYVMIIICLILLQPASAFAKVQNSIVQTNTVYTFDDLTKDLYELLKRYPESIEVKLIGHSTFHQPIYAVKIGHGEQSILINASHHGREWLTSMLVMKMIEDYASSHKIRAEYEGYSTSILDKVSIWFVPMVNPDGVHIQQTGLFKATPNQQQTLLMMNGGSVDFSRWKANGAGIDLNRQYSAGWEEIIDSAPFPFYQLYKGKGPFTAPEVRALVALTKEIQPLIALSYHSSGRVLYWYYQNDCTVLKRDWNLANQIASITGYKLDQPVETATGGGYTDWFIQTYKRPAITIEIGYEVNETNPPLTVFQEEWKRNRIIGIHVANEALKMSEGTFE